MFKRIVILCIAIVTVLGDYEEEHEYHKPLPYTFGYEIKDEHGGSQFRKEKSNGPHHVEGSYGFTDEDGMYREVHYIADESGFRAIVKTNEPGTISQNPANVKIQSHDNSREEHYDSGKYSFRDDDHEDKDDYRRRRDHGGHE